MRRRSWRSSPATSSSGCTPTPCLVCDSARRASTGAFRHGVCSGCSRRQSQPTYATGVPILGARERSGRTPTRRTVRAECRGSSRSASSGRFRLGPLRRECLRDAVLRIEVSRRVKAGLADLLGRMLAECSRGRAALGDWAWPSWPRCRSTGGGSGPAATTRSWKSIYSEIATGLRVPLRPDGLRARSLDDNNTTTDTRAPVGRMWKRAFRVPSGRKSRNENSTSRGWGDDHGQYTRQLPAPLMTPVSNAWLL